ncbi:hypothetical protein R1flu_016950 [Riccia fluitans]|uniref:F-box domain-containing protein n=1 Tax=Riccia fluitans TaxID=41844 RepID=A0ABD1YPA9_9MARC
MENSTPSENRSKKLRLHKKRKPMDHDQGGGVFSVLLPDEMIEKIISMMPYPHILNAKELNKEWYSRLSKSTKNVVNAGFREMMKNNSNDWPSFYPFSFANGNVAFMGFDRLSNSWIKYLFHLDIKGIEIELPPRRIWESQLVENISGLGSLICVPVQHFETKLFVINVFTGAWKELPQRPTVDSEHGAIYGKTILCMYLFPDGSDDYKLLTMTPLVNTEIQDNRCQVCTQVYKSKSNSWTTKLSPFKTFSFARSRGVYCNGSLYFMDHSISGLFFGLWEYNIEKEDWHQIQFPISVSLLQRFQPVKLISIVSDNQLILLLQNVFIFNDSPVIWRDSLILFQMDTITKTFSQMYTGPPEPILDASVNSYISDGDSIFFSHRRIYTKYIMEFSISNQTWTSHPHPSSCIDGFTNFLQSDLVLEPRKNPFIAP